MNSLIMSFASMDEYDQSCKIKDRVSSTTLSLLEQLSTT